ncbi:MAG: RNA polymerase sigma factor, partial [Candidatus Komeilibacteria bacterium]|nr:RNA polymerase sigma factor [Candidatus Komeilibacteria bacterium]
FLSGYADIEDVVQEVFIKGYENIKSFNTDRKFSSWLYRIAHNEFINRIKKIGREPLPFFDPDTLFPHPLSQDLSDRGILSREARELLDACLEKLSAKYREVLVLFYIEELSYQEIAEVLHIPLATVGVRLKRARGLLKTFCQQHGYNPKI